MLTVKEVPLEYVNLTWPLVEGLLKKSVEKAAGEITLEETKIFVVNGSWKLYVATDENDNIKGVATIHFFNRTDNRVAFVTNMSGKLLTSNEVFAQLREVLKSHGATCIEGGVRDSLVRLWARMGASKKYNVITIPL